MLNVFKALADENRLRILNILMKYELCVCEIELILDMTQSNASRHLSKLKAAGLITDSKETQWVHYQANKKFFADNNFLDQYLKDNFALARAFLHDMARCDIYMDSQYTCQDIRNDSKFVNEFIESKMNEK